MDAVIEKFSIYKKKIGFSFVKLHGEVWNIKYGWCNVVAGEKQSLLVIFRRVFSLNFKLLSKRTLVLHNFWCQGYYHWLADVLPKLFLLKDSLGSYEIVLPRKLNKFQVDSLSLFNIRSIKKLEYWETGMAGSLTLFKFPWDSGYFDHKVYPEMTEWLIAEVKKIQKPVLEKHKPEKVFVSRQKARCRSVEDYGLLEPILAANDFYITDLDKEGFFDQVLLFADVKLIMGPHGAGLVNMMFMASGSTVIELRNSYPQGNNCYERLAKAYGHKYIPMVANKNFVGNFQDDNITINAVDINKLFTDLFIHISQLKYL